MSDGRLSLLQIRILRALPVDNPTYSRFGTSPQALSRAVRRLEARGLVRLVKASASAARNEQSTAPRAQRTIRIESTGVV